VFTRSYSLATQQRGQLKFAASDPDGDELSYEINPLPLGASFDAITGVLSWRPSETQVGTHRLVVTVSDGQLKVQTTFEVYVDTPWEDASGSLLQPGLFADLYVPRSQRYGSFVGGGMSVALVSWIHRTNNPGPAHGQLYLAAALSQSDRPDGAVLFSYHAGFSLSFEHNPERRWLIPLYGVTFGGLLHEDFGHPFAVTPRAGAYLYAAPGVSASASAGYTLVPSRFEELSGLNVSLRLDLNVW
jgi:hypothetical protein